MQIYTDEFEGPIKKGLLDELNKEIEF